MALIPRVKLNLENKCNKVDICESTGIYNAVSNTGGWGAPNIETTVVTASTVAIFAYNGTSALQTFNMLPTYTTGIQPPYQAFDGEAWTQADGVFKLVYTVTDGVDTFTNPTEYILFTCNLCNCIEGLIAKLSEECDPAEVAKLKDTIDQLEIIKYGIQSAFSCKNFDRATTLLTNAASLCKTFTDCLGGC